jgi:hypothetical protein
LRQLGLMGAIDLDLAEWLTSQTNEETARNLLIDAEVEAVAAVIASGLLPGALEIMDALALEAAVAAVHAEYPAGCEAVLIVELEGPRDPALAIGGRAAHHEPAHVATAEPQRRHPQSRPPEPPVFHGRLLYHFRRSLAPGATVRYSLTACATSASAAPGSPSRASASAP